MPKTRGAWVGLALFVCAVLTIFTWLFFISPKLDERAELADQEAALVSENDVLETKVAALRAQFARIDEFRAQLSQLQSRIPTTAQTDDLIDEIEAAAAKHDVIVKAISAEPAQSLVGETVHFPEAEPAASEGEADANADAGADDADEEATPPAPAAPGWAADGPTDLVTLPYKIEIDADYSDVVAFIEQLQGKDGRYFLINNPVISALDLEDDKADKELNVTFTLHVFVLTDEAAAATPDEGTAAPEKTQRSKRNNFAPAS